MEHNNAGINDLASFREFLKKKSVFKANVNWLYLISSPVIYGMFIPILFFHICLEIYHQFCFRLYGIPLVKGEEYFVYDRQLWPYLNWLEKLNCLYCSYYNNLTQYAVEIGARTERYWCPIKYVNRVKHSHSYYSKFIDSCDIKDFRGKWKDLKDFSDVSGKPGEEEKKSS